MVIYYNVPIISNTQHVLVDILCEQYRLLPQDVIGMHNVGYYLILTYWISQGTYAHCDDII